MPPHILYGRENIRVNLIIIIRRELHSPSIETEVKHLSLGCSAVGSLTDERQKNMVASPRVVGEAFDNTHIPTIQVGYHVELGLNTPRFGRDDKQWQTPGHLAGNRAIASIGFVEIRSPVGSLMRPGDLNRSLAFPFSRKAECRVGGLLHNVTWLAYHPTAYSSRREQ